MPVFNNMLAGASGGAGGAGYEIERSLRFNDADDSKLTKTFSSAGNRKKWTLSFWAKRSVLGTEDNMFTGSGNFIRFEPSDVMRINHGSVTDSTRLFRDPSAWYHIVWVWDTAQSTQENRSKVYVNNEYVTFASYPSQNADSTINNNVEHIIGAQGNQYHGHDGYLADFHFIDGQALAATDFGETDEFGVWQPKKFDSFNNPNNGTTWTNSISGTADSGWAKSQTFDGTTSSSRATSGNSLTFTPSSPIPVTSLLRIKGFQLGSGSSALIVNGTDYTSLLSASASYITIPQSTITSIVWSNVGGNSDSVAVVAIEVDGYTLLDGAADNSFHLDFADNSSNAALGTDTSGNSNTWTVNNLSVAGSAWDQSQAWSSICSYVNNDTSRALSLFFNGSLDLELYSVGNARATITFPNVVPATTGEIYGQLNGATSAATRLEINGVAVTQGSSNGWTSIDTALAVEGGLKTISFGDNAASVYPHIYGVKLGGKLLVDSSVADPLVAGIDSLVDSPTNGDTASDTGAGNQITGNYATWNPLTTASATYKQGNLLINSPSNDVFTTTQAVSSGKYYVEVEVMGAAGKIGIWNFDDTSGSITGEFGWTDGGAGYMFDKDGNIYNNQNVTGYGDTYTSGDIIGIALDMDNGKVFFSKNGTFQNSGVPASGSNPAFSGLSGTFAFAVGSSLSGDAYTLNSGQRAFTHSAPSGYKSLNTANLSSTIADGSKYFDTALWTGTGSSQSISSLGFNPDFIWTKTRSNAVDHKLVDVVRGFSEVLESNQTRAENTDSNGVTGTSDTGFTLGSGGDFNSNGRTFVGWAWDAGDSNTTIAAGSLNSSAYDQSQTWSSGAEAAWNQPYSNGVTYPPTRLFDGNTSVGGFCGGSTNGSITMNITVNSSFRIKGYGQNVWYVTIGGTEYTVPFTTTGGTTLFVSLPYTGQLTKIRNTGNGGSVSAIEVDGKILVDSGVTPPNVPSIASTVRANPSAGFSIVSFTASGSAGSDSCGHGLNAVPGMVIIKRRDAADNWFTWHSSFSNAQRNYILLDSSGQATLSTNDSWGAGMTSSVIGFRSQGTAAGNMIAYCFAPVEGYSAMGSYEGNGSSSNGPFVYTGFKVSWLMVKNTTTSGETWTIYDAARDPHNLATNRLQPNASDAETSGTAARDKDFLSNGFKVRGGSGEQNTSGDNYIYLAFASNPFASNGGLAR